MLKTESNIMFESSEGNALSILYSGTGATATAAVANNTLTIAKTDVNGITLGVKGTVSTATAAISTDTLTLARAAIEGLSLTYSGDLVATVAVDTSANTLTLTIDGTPTEHDLTAGTKDTLTKIAAILNAVEDISCSVLTGADGSCASEKLDTLIEFTLVKDTAKKLTYTPANLTYDLTDPLYNTLTLLVAVLNALPEISCSLASGAVGATASGLLNDKTATSIKTGYTWLYTPADVTVDLTNASYDRLSELVTYLNTIDGITATLLANDGYVLSRRLSDKTATTIKTALTLVYVPAKPLSTTVFYDVGSIINVTGHDGITVFLTVDNNNMEDMRLKVLGSYVKGGDFYTIDHSLVSGAVLTASTNKDYIELVADADISTMFKIENLVGLKELKLQLSAGSIGVTPGKIDDIRYTLFRKD